MMFAWVFQIAVADPTVAIKNAQHVSIEMQCLAANPGNPDAAERCNDTRKRAFDKKLRELTKPASGTPSSLSSAGKAAQAEIDTGLERLISDVDSQGGWWNYLWGVLSVQFSPDRVLSGMLASPFFFLLVAGLWIGLVQYAEVNLATKWLRWPIKLVLGTVHAAAHLTVLLATNSILGDHVQFLRREPKLHRQGVRHGPLHDADDPVRRLSRRPCVRHLLGRDLRVVRDAPRSSVRSASGTTRTFFA